MQSLIDADHDTSVPSGVRTARWGPRRLILILAISATAVLATGGAASAHQWGAWHWHRGGTVYIYVWNGCGSYSSICEAARSDIHNHPHPVYLINTSDHTDVSLLAGNYGNTGWVGLAEMINYSYPHVTHAHATYNSYYDPYYSNIQRQGVMCQEIAHTLGLDHAATGDCMALGYYAGGTNYFGSAAGYSASSHPTGDLKTMYSTLK
jgi:hypothetical protein